MLEAGHVARDRRDHDASHDQRRRLPGRGHNASMLDSRGILRVQLATRAGVAQGRFFEDLAEAGNPLQPTQQLLGHFFLLAFLLIVDALGDELHELLLVCFFEYLDLHRVDPSQTLLPDLLED